MKYTPQLYPRKDKAGNVHHVAVVYDNHDNTYVGTIRGGAHIRVCDGSMRQAIVALGEGLTPHEAADCAILTYECCRSDLIGSCSFECDPVCTFSAYHLVEPSEPVRSSGSAVAETDFAGKLIDTEGD